MSKINLNKATKKDLQKLPGIGSMLAKSIIDLRTASKKDFQSIEEIKQLRGITDPVYQKIKNLISISDDVAKSKALDKKAASDHVLYACGEPGRIRLNLPLDERHSSKQVDIRFANDRRLTDSNNCALDDVVIRRRIFSRKGRNLKIKIPLSKHTPPGSYKTNIIANDVQYKALIEITKKVTTTIIPRKIYIEKNDINGIEQTFLVSNNGNVPLTFRNPGAVILEPDFIECRTIRASVKKLQTVKDMAQVLSTVAGELEKLYTESGALRIQVKGAPVTIQPGSTQKVDLIIKLPEGIKNSVHYEGTFRFYNSIVTIIVKIDD